MEPSWKIRICLAQEFSTFNSQGGLCSRECSMLSPSRDRRCSRLRPARPAVPWPRSGQDLSTTSPWLCHRWATQLPSHLPTRLARQPGASVHTTLRKPPWISQQGAVHCHQARMGNSTLPQSLRSADEHPHTARHQHQIRLLAGQAWGWGHRWQRRQMGARCLDVRKERCSRA